MEIIKKKEELLEHLACTLWTRMDEHDDAIFVLQETEDFAAIDFLEKYPKKIEEGEEWPYTHILPEDINLKVLYDELMELAVDELYDRVAYYEWTFEIDYHITPDEIICAIVAPEDFFLLI